MKLTNNDQNLWWIITDLDGTLMDHKYDFEPALSTIKLLQKRGFPIIPCTSKTASEVRVIRKDIGLSDPFIVENGGAIYGNHEFSSEEWELAIGKKYKYLRPKLDIISSELDYNLTALNDLSYSKINDLTGLNASSIELALKREWSVPFLNPPESLETRLRKISIKHGTTVYKGNRMSHLLAKGSDKGRAVIELKKFLKQSHAKVIALGDSQNDLPLLQIADKAVVVPSKDGPNLYLKEGISKGHFMLAPAPHAEGWALAIRNILEGLI